MKFDVVRVIFLILLSVKMSDQAISKPQRPPSISITSTARLGYPKVLKRSTASPLLSAFIEPRILSKKPVNVLQNGPYFINHYIYCDHIDKSVLQQIKAGTISSEKALELLNFNRNKLDTLNSFKSSLNSLPSSGVFSGNKEIHILDLPTNKPHSTFGSYFPQSLPVDLELNQHFDSFDVDLGGITPPKSSINLDFLKSTTEVVEPLLQGHIQTSPIRKFNPNLDQLVHYLNGNADGHQGETGDVVVNPQGEHLEIPHFEKHPLEHDPSKSTYDTAGAVDSYGEPITPTNIHRLPSVSSYFGHADSLPFASNSHQQPFPLEFSEDSKENSDSDIIKHFNELNNFNRNRRGSEEEDDDDTVKNQQERGDQGEVRHPNHKYD